MLARRRHSRPRPTPLRPEAPSRSRCIEVEPDVAGAEGAVAEPEAEVGLPAEGETLPGLHPWPGIESLPEAKPAGPEREPEPVGDAEAEAEAGPPTGAVKEQERLRAAPDVIADGEPWRSREWPSLPPP